MDPEMLHSRQKPKQGVRREGAETVLSYHAECARKQIEKNGKRTCNDTFVLFVGEKGAGKTTLVQQFLGKGEKRIL